MTGDSHRPEIKLALVTARRLRVVLQIIARGDSHLLKRRGLACFHLSSIVKVFYGASEVLLKEIAFHYPSSHCDFELQVALEYLDS